MNFQQRAFLTALLLERRGHIASLTQWPRLLRPLRPQSYPTSWPCPVFFSTAETVALPATLACPTAFAAILSYHVLCFPRPPLLPVAADSRGSNRGRTCKADFSMGWSTQRRKPEGRSMVEQWRNGERRSTSVAASLPPAEAHKRRPSSFRPPRLPPSWAASLVGCGSEELVCALCSSDAAEAGAM